jgi:folate-binding Fe-S cluster repair protein YgfZ
LSQDLSQLDAKGLWSLVLSPSSAVLTSCLIERVDEGFSLLVPRSLGESTLARLRRFLLRTNCTLELDNAERGPVDTVLEQVRSAMAGPSEFALELTPQSFGDEFVRRTVSFTKGCFTGQELVGRLDARGSSVPWRYVRALGPSLVSIDEALRTKGPEGPGGVTTAVTTSEGVLALGFIHRRGLDNPELLETFGVHLDVIG